MKASFKKLAARTGAVAALASSMAFALPAFAFAAEKKTSGIAAILPTMDEFIPMVVAFLILLAILAKWGWPMFDKVLVKRENTIRAALEQAEENRIESERVLKEYQDRLIDAREEASTIVSEAKQQAEAQRAEIDLACAGRGGSHHRQGTRDHQDRAAGRSRRAAGLGC